MLNAPSFIIDLLLKDVNHKTTFFVFILGFFFTLFYLTSFLISIIIKRNEYNEKGDDMDLALLKENLERLHYSVKIFENKETAADYLAESICGKTVGIGGSVTICQMELYEKLKERNSVLWHLRTDGTQSVMQVRKDATRADIYISSVNGISQKGEIVNIDNTGNRVAAATFGCDKVYFVIGKNKIAPTLEDAISRARNIASPLNAKRLGLKTPCAVHADKCYDCNSEQRICRNLSIFLKKPTGCDYEIILIDEVLGY